MMACSQSRLPVGWVGGILMLPGTHIPSLEEKQEWPHFPSKVRLDRESFTCFILRGGFSGVHNEQILDSCN